LAVSVQGDGRHDSKPMKIDRPCSAVGKRWAGQPAFTLIEVAFAAAIAALVMAGMFSGYSLAGRKAQYSVCSVAANARAMEQLEHVIAAKWFAGYGITQLLNMSGTQYTNLDLPSAVSNIISCTNVTTVSQISVNPPYAMIQVQCSWTLPSYGGVYTNTVAVLRAPNL